MMLSFGYIFSHLTLRQEKRPASRFRARLGFFSPRVYKWEKNTTYFFIQRYRLTARRAM